MCWMNALVAFSGRDVFFTHPRSLPLSLAVPLSLEGEALSTLAGHAFVAAVGPACGTPQIKTMQIVQCYACWWINRVLAPYPPSAHKIFWWVAVQNRVAAPYPPGGCLTHLVGLPQRLRLPNWPSVLLAASRLSWPVAEPLGSKQRHPHTPWGRAHPRQGRCMLQSTA